MNETLAPLLSNREKLLAYIKARISSPDLAEDILQDGLLKALRGAPDLREHEKLIPWFYRILNNAIIDSYRRKGSHSKHIGQWQEAYDQIPEPEPEDVAVLCSCFRELIPALRPEYATMIEELDLAGGDPSAMAERLRIDLNNLKVRRHRARKALRKKLEETCRLCAKHGCLDCTCGGK